jgi:hypothetical protein
VTVNNYKVRLLFAGGTYKHKWFDSERAARQWAEDELKRARVTVPDDKSLGADCTYYGAPVFNI